MGKKNVFNKVQLAAQALSKFNAKRILDASVVDKSTELHNRFDELVNRHDELDYTLSALRVDLMNLAVNLDFDFDGVDSDVEFLDIVSSVKDSLLPDIKVLIKESIKSDANKYGKGLADPKDVGGK